MLPGRVLGTLIGLLFVFCPPLWAIDASRLQEIFRQYRLNPQELGVLIEDENGKLFALNETKKLKPASLTKILTAGAALEYLGKDFVFKTQMISDAPVVNRSLKGSLYLKAAGDPEFNKEKLSAFLGALQQRGITRIDGNIVIDDSQYSDIHAKDSRSLPKSVNTGRYPLFVNVDPPTNLVPHSRQWRKAESRLRRLLDLNDSYVIYQNMAQPDLWTGHHFRSLLQRSGIRVDGKVIRGSAPVDAEVFGTVSNPLTEVIRDMLKSSNNFYADIMIRNLAAEAGEKPATVQAGMEFIYVFLDHVGIGREEYFLNCGAGFTHINYISAGALSKILNHLRSEDSISEIFFGSLPVAGVDGTLKTRMRRTVAQGRVHAKTGYLGRVLTRFRKLDGVVALGGFADAMNGKVMTFVFLYNGTKPPGVVRATFDKVLVELVQEPIRALTSVPASEHLPTN
jgi:serine-type D-Ala-D-Ala carboxypeptidase/endopeptidase (penicillin-binding protein 4)